MKLKMVCTLICLLPSLATAKSVWYEVELIIFAHNSNRYLSTEIWPQEPATPLRNNALFLVDLPTFQSMGGNNQTMLIMLSQNQLKLRDISNKLSGSGYQPLFHGAWRQLVHEREQARAIYIRSSQSLPLAQAASGEIPHIGPVSRAPMQTAGQPILEGTLTLSLSRYLHAYFDLQYSVRNPDYRGEIMPAAVTYPATTAESDEAQAKPEMLPAPQFLKYKLVQHRRMRTQKLHFIDHPKFGIFLKIWPYEAAGGAAPGNSGVKSIPEENGLKVTPLRR
jgi:hypothetical protein